MSNPPLIYLASPYTAPDAETQNDRYRAACRFVAASIRRGDLVFAPIVHSHALHTDHDCGGDFETWRALDIRLLSAADELWILKLEGWARSVGVAAEIRYAIEHDMPVTYVEEEPNA